MARKTTVKPTETAKKTKSAETTLELEELIDSRTNENTNSECTHEADDNTALIRADSEQRKEDGSISPTDNKSYRIPTNIPDPLRKIQEELLEEGVILTFIDNYTKVIITTTTEFNKIHFAPYPIVRPMKYGVTTRGRCRVTGYQTAGTFEENTAPDEWVHTYDYFDLADNNTVHITGLVKKLNIIDRILIRSYNEKGNYDKVLMIAKRAAEKYSAISDLVSHMY